MVPMNLKEIKKINNIISILFQIKQREKIYYNLRSVPILKAFRQDELGKNNLISFCQKKTWQKKRIMLVMSISPFSAMFFNRLFFLRTAEICCCGLRVRSDNCQMIPIINHI